MIKVSIVNSFWNSYLLNKINNSKVEQCSEVTMNTES